MLRHQVNSRIASHCIGGVGRKALAFASFSFWEYSRNRNVNKGKIAEVFSWENIRF